jgi:hypothetical protein
VQIVLPVPWFLYSAVKVLVPGATPVRTAAAVARCNADPARITAFVSEAPTLVAENDIRQDVEFELPIIWAVTCTSTLPEAGTVTVAAGPGDPGRGA